MSIASTMTALADAVRAKTGASGPLSVAAMTNALDGMIDAGKLIDRTITTATIPPGATAVGTYAFCYCTSLASVTIPAGVTSIGVNAFYSCSSLASVTIPAGLTSIGNTAFSGCSALTSITLPASLTTMGTNVFVGCSRLRDIYCGFAEGEVSGAPWGAPAAATIHYNSTGE